MGSGRRQPVLSYWFCFLSKNDSAMLLMKLLTYFKGKLVGEDAYGNRYFEEKFLFSKPNRPPRRWVLYRGYADASKVPAEWHGWLHFTYESPLQGSPKGWQKKHLRNLSGTPKAYVPPASLTRPGGQRQAPSKPYEPWTPASGSSSTSSPS